MDSGIVNGHQLLCDAHTVPEQHRGTAALYSRNWKLHLTSKLFLGPEVLTVSIYKEI